MPETILTAYKCKKCHSVTEKDRSTEATLICRKCKLIFTFNHICVRKHLQGVYYCEGFGAFRCNGCLSIVEHNELDRMTTIEFKNQVNTKNIMIWTNPYICKECQSEDLVIDSREGELICKNCGLVNMEHISNDENLYDRMEHKSNRDYYENIRKQIRFTINSCLPTFTKTHLIKEKDIKRFENVLERTGKDIVTYDHVRLVCKNNRIPLYKKKKLKRKWGDISATILGSYSEVDGEIRDVCEKTALSIYRMVNQFQSNNPYHWAVIKRHRNNIHYGSVVRLSMAMIDNIHSAEHLNRFPELVTNQRRSALRYLLANARLKLLENRLFDVIDPQESGKFSLL